MFVVSHHILANLRLPILLMPLFFAATAQAVLHREKLEYKQGDAALEGYLAYDDMFKGPRPGIVLFHDWMGVGPYVQGRADQLAEMGYVVLAADVYGKGIRPATREEARTQAGIYYADRPLMRARAQAGLDALRRLPPVDSTHIVAMGYCFGGGAALELARSGADIVGVVSFHGSLNTTMPAESGAVKAKLLVLQGADDPVAPINQIGAFEDEMRKAGADYQIILCGGAVHTFTNPAAGNNPATGSAYNKDADRRSWAAMKQFFQEVFGEAQIPNPKLQTR
jgi:dienelactone hydrolase